MAYDNSYETTAGVGDTFTFSLHYGAFTADVSVGPRCKLPWKGKIVHLNGIVNNIGGTTVFSDVDLVLKNITQSTTVATLAAVDGSTIPSGGATATPTSNASFAAGDVFEMEIDVTGGNSPTATGCQITAYCVRE